MADLSELGLLLGIDPKVMQALAAQYQPTDEDRAQQHRDKWMTTALGILSAPPGNVMGAIGRGGLLGMQAGEQTRQQQQAQRAQMLQTLPALQEAMRKNALIGQLSPQQATSMPQQGPAPGMMQQGPAPGMPPQQPSAPSAQGGGNMYQKLKAIGVSDAEIAMAAQSKDPATAVADLFKEYTKPMFGQDKIPMLRTAEGFKAAPVAGYNEQLAEQARVLEEAKAKFDLVDVPIGNGQTVKMPRSEAIKRLGGGGQPGAGPGPGAAPAQPPQQLGMTPNPVVQAAAMEQAKKEGDTLGTLYDTTQKAAMQATGKISRMQRLQTLLEGVDTGKLTPLGTELAAWGKAAGLNVGPNVGNVQAAQSLGRELALELRNPSGGAGMPGALSDADRQFLESMIPDAAKTPEGRSLIVDTAIKLHKRDQQVGQVVRQYKRDHGGQLDSGVFDKLQEYSEAHPLFTSADVKTTKAAPQAPRLTPAGQGNQTVRAILQQNPTPQQLDALRAKGYIQ
jgi:hypothetical protein